MANYDDMAFNALGTDNDAYITGGALTVSEYEHNMSPTDQRSYEQALLRGFQESYSRDPYKRNLNFTHWLESLNPDLVRERAKKWEDIEASERGVDRLRSMDQREALLLEDAGLLQKLAHLHTGRIEDIMEIVKLESLEQYDEPYEAYQTLTPSAGQMDRGEYTRFREQGSQPLPPE